MRACVRAYERVFGNRVHPLRTSVLTCVGSPVCLQVGALGVHLIAALEITPVDASLLGLGRLGPPRAPYAVNTERRHRTAKK